MILIARSLCATPIETAPLLKIDFTQKFQFQEYSVLSIPPIINTHLNHPRPFCSSWQTTLDWLEWRSGTERTQKSALRNCYPISEIEIESILKDYTTRRDEGTVLRGDIIVFTGTKNIDSSESLISSFIYLGDSKVVETQKVGTNEVVQISNLSDVISRNKKSILDLRLRIYRPVKNKYFNLQEKIASLKEKSQDF